MSMGFNARAQVDLIDFQSMPDGEYNFCRTYQAPAVVHACAHTFVACVVHACARARVQEHGSKFTTLAALKRKTGNLLAVSLIPDFTLLGPPLLLGADNGKEMVRLATTKKKKRQKKGKRGGADEEEEEEQEELDELVYDDDDDDEDPLQDKCGTCCDMPEDVVRRRVAVA